MARTSHSESALALTAELSKKRSRDSLSKAIIKRLRNCESDNCASISADSRSITELNMAPTPYKPNIEETTNYYLGFSGLPRLIARTGGDPWSKPLDHSPYYPSGSRQIEKTLDVVSDQEIISKWSRDLDHSLIKALSQCKWRQFFPIRIGLVDPARRHGWDKKVNNLSTVLLIAVDKGSLEWEEGIQIALECRRLLQSYGIDNIEVEICEGGHCRQAACAKLEAQIEKPASQSHKETNMAVLKMVVPTGYPIAYLDNTLGQGTVGLHLKLDGQDSKFYGLTCRHVVSNGRKPHESYTCSEDDRQHHIQGSVQELDDIYSQLKDMNESLKWDLEFYKKQHDEWEWYQFDEAKAHLKPSSKDTQNLLSLQKNTEYNTKILESIQALENKSSRKIGHLAYHPRYEASSNQLGYLKDWALIEMDSEKFLHGPENQVFICGEDEYCNEFRTAMRYAKAKRNTANMNACAGGVLDLRLPEPSEKVTEPRYVGMRGSKSGLTFGQTSGIEAVLREDLGDGTSVYTWELLVIPKGDKTYFSQAGDSGSCVFDLQGRVVGLLVSSSANDPDNGKKAWRGIASEINGPCQQKEYPGYSIRPEDGPETSGLPKIWTAANPVDFSFVSPIRWVLDDIQAFTGFRPRLP